MNTILKRDSELFNYEKVFGSTTDFLPTLLVDAGFLDIEPPGSVACTCYTACNVASAITGVKYDINWLWTQMVQAGKTALGGASPQDAFAMAVRGLRNVFTGETTKPVVAYFQCEIGQYDFFTNVKSAIQMEYNKGFKRPVGCGTIFYPNWVSIPPNSVFSTGIGTPSDHEWEVCGWDDTTHPNCFQINWWGGRKNWITQDEFNSAMDATYGSVALTFAVTDQEKIDFLKSQKVAITSKLFDLIYNTLKQIQVLIDNLKKKPMITEIEPQPLHSMQKNEIPLAIVTWARSIEKWEGADIKLNNPGNLKYSSTTAEWGATRGKIAKDGGNFCQFNSFVDGFHALCEFLILGCKDELKDYHLSRTLTEFTKKYAGNPPQGYINGIIKDLGVSGDTKINTFL